MTRPALRAAGALLFLSTFPPLAAAQVQAPPAAKAPPAMAARPRVVPPPPSPVALALGKSIEEVMAGRSKGTYAQWLETLPGFRFSPATSAQLIKLLGTDKLFSVQRQAVPGGGRDFLLTVPALRHLAPDGSTFSWDAMDGNLRVAPDGVSIVNRFAAPRMAFEDKTMRLEVRSATASGTARDGAIAYGDASAEIGNMTMTMKADGATVALDGLFGKFATVDENATVSIAYETGIRTLAAQGERFDDLHMAMRLTGLDKAAVEKFSTLGKRSNLNKVPPNSTPAERQAILAPLLRQLGIAVTARGAAVALDDISFRYQGATARMSGQIHLENATQADLDQPLALVKKVAGHADIQVPVAMLRAFADNMARKQLAKQQPGADAAAIATAGGAIYDGLLKSVVGSGYARVEGDMVVTSIDVRDGAILINGKPFDFPKPGAPVAAVNSNGLMRARRIADKCTLPDYPSDVVAQDRALAMTMQMTVNPDGSVSKLALARSSGLPDYDKAVLAAAARCTYIPALRGGKPVAVPEVWDIVRVPGTTRP